ncbi:RelA/SpoT domain-containing protein, partial [Bdellovibrionales bacterium]|nr:RelA/SpoT domain-containing protein [Bdellovibrionales bacterium]
MKKQGFIYSKSKVDKAGIILKSNAPNSLKLEEQLVVLSAWRAYHARPLNSFATVLKSRVKKISQSDNAIVAQRLKRIPSILLKLKTHETMRLSAMQDIGGLRAIFDSVSEAYELLELYRSSQTKHTFISLDDYIEKPKQDGYRGAHLVYKINKTPSLYLEIQIRSHLQHIWATGVEVFGTLKNSSFKSGYGDDKWLNFFSLLSSVFALKENCPVLEKHKNLSKAELLKKTKKNIQTLKVVDQLNIYTNLYEIITVAGSREPKGRKGHYSLILLDSQNNKIRIETFSVDQIENATNKYLRLEKQHYEEININVVLVNTGDIKKLAISYPNYFMDTKTLNRNLSLITMDRFL